jgi:hypothetical protein
MLASLARTIASFPNPGPVPALDSYRDPELGEATRRLLEIEKEDRSELIKLAKKLKSVAGTSLWELVVELLIRDTEKHMHILRFLASHASR